MSSTSSRRLVAIAMTTGKVSKVRLSFNLINMPRYDKKHTAHFHTNFAFLHSFKHCLVLISENLSSVIYLRFMLHGVNVDYIIMVRPCQS